jgi:hypothetical protein
MYLSNVVGVPAREAQDATALGNSHAPAAQDPSLKGAGIGLGHEPMHLSGPPSVIVVRTLPDLAPYVTEWEELASEAIVPNPFYEPWMLIPALRLLRETEDLHIVLVLGEVASPSRRRILCGLFPFRRTTRYRHVPIVCFSPWRHRYCFLCTPLMRRGLENECLDALFHWLGSNHRNALLDLDLVDGEGPFDNALVTYLNRQEIPWHTVHRFTRDVMRRSQPSPDTYMQVAFSSTRRKKFRHQARQLAALGRVETTVLSDGGDAERWVREFLDLEASGWKGRQHSALAARESDAVYFHEIAMAAIARDQLKLMALRLDGKPIAMRCTFISSDVAFVCKIAYDEQYRSYSPGIRLELESVQHFYADTRLQYEDGCVEPDPSRSNLIFSDYRSIQRVLIPVGGFIAQSLVAAMPLARLASRSLRVGLRRHGRIRQSPVGGMVDAT